MPSPRVHLFLAAFQKLPELKDASSHGPKKVLGIKRAKGLLFVKVEPIPTVTLAASLVDDDDVTYNDDDVTYNATEPLQEQTAPKSF